MIKRIYIFLILTLLSTSLYAGTLTDNLNLYKPAYNESGDIWWSKINDNFDILDAHLEGWVNSNKYASINAAVTAIGSTSTTLVVTEAETLTANLTIPSTLRLVILKGGSIVKASTYTLTINGSFESGLYKVFTGFDAGDVTFGSGSVKEIYSEWWGENTIPGTTDMAIPIQSALTAGATSHIPIKSLGQTYATGTALSLTTKYDWIWEGVGSGYSGASTVIKWIGAADATMFTCYGCRWFEINNIRFDGNSLAGAALQLRNSVAADVFSNFISHGLATANCTGSPGTGLYLGEGDASPGISEIYLYNYRSDANVEGIRINNGGGQSIHLYGGYLMDGTYGIHFQYGGHVDCFEIEAGNNTSHFYMPGGEKLNLHGGYFEDGNLINWGNHDGREITMMGILNMEDGVPGIITYAGGDLNIVSINNSFQKGITLAVAGSQNVKLVSLNDRFLTGGWTNENLSSRNNFIVDGGAVTFGYSGTVVWDPGSLNDGAGAYKDVTVVGAELGDYVMVAAPYSLQEIICTGYVSVAGNAIIKLQNETGGAIDLGSGTWKVRVMK